MAQTAFSIQNVSASGSIVESFPSGPSPIFVPQLSVNFQIFDRGPNHVAGLILTTDSWVTSQIVPAQFQGFGEAGGTGIEFWNATFTLSSEGGVTLSS